MSGILEIICLVKGKRKRGGWRLEKKRIKEIRGGREGGLRKLLQNEGKGWRRRIPCQESFTWLKGIEMGNVWPEKREEEGAHVYGKL